MHDPRTTRIGTVNKERWRKSSNNNDLFADIKKNHPKPLLCIVIAIPIVTMQARHSDSNLQSGPPAFDLNLLLTNYEN